MSRDPQWDDWRDAEVEPFDPRRRQRIPLSPLGSVRVATARATHGAECGCSYCAETPLTDAALDVLRKAALL